MDITTIFMIIIVVILIYVLYIYFVKKSAVIATSASLLNGNNQPITTINSGQSTQFAYGIWVYVNTWNTTTQKIIFQRQGGSISLYLDSNKPSLYCHISTNPPTPPGENGDILITDNFPVQKWVYIVVSMDTNILDCYLDGKLITSNKMAGTSVSPGPASKDPILLGSGWDAYIAGFNNWAGPIGPQEAWDSYLTGNGNTVSRFFSAYGMTLSFSKDNVEQSSYKIF
jgi:Concanavalin A-like lectin/glucanases superfamily